MYAIIESGNRQYRVGPESVIEVNRLPLEEGAAFETDRILLYDQDGKDVRIGAPYVAEVKVKGKVVSHFRGKKIIVFKHKRRKNYRRKRGHRQELTRLLIETIEVGGKSVKAAQPTPKEASSEAAEKIPAKESAPKSGAARKAPAKVEAKSPAKSAAKDTKDKASKAKAAKDSAGTSKDGAKADAKDKG